ncbi:MAG: recombinase RecA [Fusobacteriaceae bacterium]|jgi:recombination protein RecA|nr:recombinase RecA [Fusobacteriaceae bacterium]
MARLKGEKLETVGTSQKESNQKDTSTKKECASPEKVKALDLAMKQIKKDFGDGSIMKLGESTSMIVETISTGSINLNIALGVGGVPRGRVIEVYGAESSGKTTIALHILAEAQKKGGIGAFIDAEHALDPEYAKALGVDIDELLISQPDYGEQALEIADMLVRSGAVDVIVIDSVAALVPKVEIDGEMSDQQMGLQARLMSKALRKLTGTLSKSKTTMVFINQIREKIGGFGFGPQTTTTGGKALKFYSSVRLEAKRIGSIKQGDEVIGNETIVKVTKNKVAPPFKEAAFQIMYGKGISKIGEIFEIALENNIVAKAGAWFSLDDTRLGQGKENVKAQLEENKVLFKTIEDRVMEVIANNKLKASKKIPDICLTDDSVIGATDESVAEIA